MIVWEFASPMFELVLTIFYLKLGLFEAKGLIKAIKFIILDFKHFFCFFKDGRFNIVDYFLSFFQLYFDSIDHFSLEVDIIGRLIV